MRGAGDVRCSGEMLCKYTQEKVVELDRAGWAEERSESNEEPDDKTERSGETK